MTDPQPLLVGRLPFLVCAPFFHSSLSGAPGIQFQDGVPSQLNAALQAGLIDCAPSSSFEYALHFRDYRLFPGISTSSRMEMKSVLFLSQVPWEDLDGRSVLLSPDSATSNILFQILSTRYFGVKPILLLANQAGPAAVSDAAVSETTPSGQVFIGDRALHASLSGKWTYHYDLADIWAKWQGLPFSFGLWMVKRNVIEAKAVLVQQFFEILKTSLASFRADPEFALDAWTRAYPSTLPRSLMLRFYETADYSFTPAHAQSLGVFYQLAFEEGFLTTLPSLEYVPVA